MTGDQKIEAACKGRAVAMKAITIRQPWASLIAEGIKTIETRSWSTKYRGPIAIHAGQHLPEKGEWPLPYPPWTMWLDEFGDRWLQQYTFSDPNTIDTYECWPMPLGAVVATANLIDVVPILPPFEKVAGRDAVTNDTGGVLAGPRIWRQGHYSADVSDQLPFGDFTPGRYAWLLADITKLDPPQPAKGRQGLWNWGPT